MGIRFFCPAGHKIHVKSFLRGKKAICPKCGVHVVIPDESQPAPAAREESTHADDSSDDVLVGGLAALELANLEVGGGKPEGSVILAEMAPLDVLSADAARLPASAPAGPPTDPIAEAPAAQWYVRPASGGQYGPAPGDVMKAWITEGRVGASSLVWRAGWPDWRVASDAFPQLALTPPRVQVPPSGPPNQGPPPVPVAVPIAPGAPSSTIAVDDPLGMPVRKRHKKTEPSLIASAILGVISFILVIVLIWVWQRRNAAEDATAVEPAAAESTTE